MRTVAELVSTHLSELPREHFDTVLTKYNIYWVDLYKVSVHFDMPLPLS